MPIYEYECEDCGKIEEALQKMSDAPLKQCRHCNGALHRLISQSSFHLKGTGWYVTDYAGKTGQPPAKSESKSETAAPAESKPAQSSSDSGGTKKAD